MPNINEIHIHALATKNKDVIETCEYYLMSTSKMSRYYYFGGHLAMNVNANITPEVIEDVEFLLFYEGGDTLGRSQEMIALDKKDVHIIKNVIEDMTARKARYIGLLKSIVYWLSPSRKRSAECVYHPSRISFEIKT